MKNEILGLLTEALSEERLERILEQEEGYQTAYQEEIKAHETLEATLSKEQRKLLDEFVVASAQKAAVLERIHYQQGMKDLYNLLRSLEGSCLGER